jgi:hypothetical protein
MERVQPPEQRNEEELRQRVPRERDPARLPKLIALAKTESEGVMRQEYAAEINRLLRAMRAPGNEREEARAVMKELDLQSLVGLSDGFASCRAEAIETVLVCGFPEALRLTPEDMKFHAEARRDRRRSYLLIPAMLTLFAAMHVLQTRRPGRELVMPLAVGLSIALTLGMLGSNKARMWWRRRKGKVP